MNKAQAILYMYPQADPVHDFEVIDKGTEWVYLTPDGSHPKYAVPIPNSPELAKGESPVEGIHFTMEFMKLSEMVEGTHYRVENNGQQIRKWNIKDAQGNIFPIPTDTELQAAYDNFVAAEAVKPVPENLEQKAARLETDNAQLNLQVIDLWETLIAQGVIS